MSRFSRSSLSVTIVLTAALVGVVIFLVYDSEIKKRLEDDVFRITYQFLLIVVLGGAVSLLLKNLSSERDISRERRSALREMHSELLTSFNVVKRVRRTLRARVGYSKEGLDPRSLVAVSVYEEKIEDLMDAQLNFEIYTKRAADSHLWFENGAALATELGDVESYLNEIIEEYENELSNFEANPSGRLLKCLPVLSEFIGPYNQAIGFKSKLTKPFKRALLELSNAGLS